MSVVKYAGWLFRHEASVVVPHLCARRICICIYSGFDAVYHIVIIFLDLSFGACSSIFVFYYHKYSGPGIMMFSYLLDPTRCQEASWLSGASALFAMVSGHLPVNNVGCWAFSPFHLCSGAVGAMRWVYWAQVVPMSWQGSLPSYFIAQLHLIYHETTDSHTVCML
jgi:hypothetical protein